MFFLFQKNKTKTKQTKQPHMWPGKKRCACQLCGSTACKLCDNCRGKHSWWKAISQIILATIRKCGGVKWRFHMQMCQWERSGTLPNSSDPTPPLWFASCGTERHKETNSPSREDAGNTGFNHASIMANPNNNNMRHFFAFTTDNNHRHARARALPRLRPPGFLG